ERNGDGAETRRGKNADDEFRPIADKEADAVAGPDAARREGGGDIRRPLVELAPGYPRLSKDDRFALRVALSGICKQLEQAGGPLDEAFDDAIAVMGFTPHRRQPPAEPRYVFQLVLHVVFHLDFARRAL